MSIVTSLVSKLSQRCPTLCVSSVNLAMMEQRSPLMKLPRELRNMIWRFAVTDDNPIDVTTFTKPNERALMATCKQIRNESQETFYKENTFYTLTTTKQSEDDPYFLPRGWLQTLGQTRCALITKFHVAIGVDVGEEHEVSEKTVLSIFLLKSICGAIINEADNKARFVCAYHVASLRRLGLRPRSLHFVQPQSSEWIRSGQSGRPGQSDSGLDSCYKEATEEIVRRHEGDTPSEGRKQAAARVFSTLR